MKKNSQEPVKVVLTYRASNSEMDTHTTVVTGTVTKTEGKLAKTDDNASIVKRYSFDDNGGGYLGL